MSEREHFKRVLEKVINDTENNRIQTSKELIEALIYELSNIEKLVTKSKQNHPNFS